MEVDRKFIIEDFVSFTNFYQTFILTNLIHLLFMHNLFLSLIETVDELQNSFLIPSSKIVS